MKTFDALSFPVKNVNDRNDEIGIEPLCVLIIFIIIFLRIIAHIGVESLAALLFAGETAKTVVVGVTISLNIVLEIYFRFRISLEIVLGIYFRSY